MNFARIGVFSAIVRMFILNRFENGMHQRYSTLDAIYIHIFNIVYQAEFNEYNTLFIGTIQEKLQTLTRFAFICVAYTTISDEITA